MGFDMQNEAPEIPKHFKALCQGRMVRYAYQYGKTRPAVVVDVLDKAVGVVELHIFWGQNAVGVLDVREGTNEGGVVRYQSEDEQPIVDAGTWHWPPFEG